MLREDRLGSAQADLRRARETGRTGGVEVDVVGGITGLIKGVLGTNVIVTTQGRGRRTELDDENGPYAKLFNKCDPS